MRKKLYLYIIILTILLLGNYSCHFQLFGFRSNINAVASTKDFKEIQALPFELNRNLIFLNVGVNNSKPYRFLLDSGADTSVISQELANTLKLDMKNPGKAEGVGENEVNITFAKKKVEFNISGISFFIDRVAIIPLEGLSPNVGHSIDGILGHDFISKVVLEIDYQNKIINILNPKNYKYNGAGERIKLKVNEGGRAVLQARILLPNGNLLEGTFKLDTGSAKTISIRRPFVETNKLLEVIPKLIERSSLGVGGESKEFIGRVKAILVGSFIMESPILSLSQATSGSMSKKDTSGTIGTEVLRRFKVVLDYSHETIILEPNKFYSEQFQGDMFGAVVKAYGADFKSFKIFKVYDNTPAAESGLKENDIIISIDDQPVSQLSFNDLIKMFKQEGETYQLYIKRGDENLKISVKMRKLI